MGSAPAQILVVDDDPAARYTVTRVLHQIGHAVTEAGTGRQALDMARATRPDLMILDVRLPDMLGFDVAEELRADPATSSLAILQLSASYTRADAQAEGLTRGADAYLTHPFEPALLSATVEALLRMRRAELREKHARDRAQASQRRFRGLARAARGLAAQRKQLIAELRVQAQRRDEFLATLSHELRNPLTPIRNSLFVLQHADPNGEAAARALRVIERQAGHMSRLVDDLLDVTRIARGNVLVRREPVALHDLVQRAVEDYQEPCRRAEIQLHPALEAQPLIMSGDPTRLAQLVANLLQNAVESTPPGGRITVSLAAEPHDMAVLRVKDTGAGLDEERLQVLFDPRATPSESLDGARDALCLGLAVVRGVAELHGGSVRAASAGPGLGAEFVVTLPIDASLSSEAPELAPISQVRPCHVLIIEDNVDSAQMLSDVLERCSHRVSVAHTGEEGVARALELLPGVVICDIGLPDIDGHEVGRRLRADPRLDGAHLVALSGYALKDDIAKSQQAGFDRHLAKPLDISELQRLLAEFAAR